MFVYQTSMLYVFPSFLPSILFSYIWVSFSPPFLWKWKCCFSFPFYFFFVCLEYCGMTGFVAIFNRNVTNPKYAPLLVDVCGIVLEVYGQEVSRSQLLQKMLLAMKHRVEQEVQFLLQAHQLLGVMDTVLATSVSTRNSSHRLPRFQQKSQARDSTSNSKHLICTWMPFFFIG